MTQAKSGIWLFCKTLPGVVATNYSDWLKYLGISQQKVGIIHQTLQKYFFPA